MIVVNYKYSISSMCITYVSLIIQLVFSHCSSVFMIRHLFDFVEYKCHYI